MRHFLLFAMTSVCAVRLTAARAASNDVTPWTNNDAEVELSAESSLCMAYFAVARQCAINSGRPDAGNRATKAMTAASNLAVATAKAAGEADDAILAQIKIASDQVRAEIHGTCINMANAAVKYGLPCKMLTEAPINRLRALQAGPSSNLWP